MAKKKKVNTLKGLAPQWAKEIKKIVINGTSNYQPILTTRQYETLTNWMAGKITQIDLGKKLGICQTSIHKTLFGNIDYRANKKRYGGVFKKIQKFHTGNYIIGKGGYIRKK